MHPIVLFRVVLLIKMFIMFIILIAIVRHANDFFQKRLHNVN